MAFSRAVAKVLCVYGDGVKAVFVFIALLRGAKVYDQNEEADCEGQKGEEGESERHGIGKLTHYTLSPFVRLYGHFRNWVCGLYAGQLRPTIRGHFS